MGLDIYLYRCKDLAALKEFEDRQTAAHDAIYEQISAEPGSMLGLSKQFHPKARDKYLVEIEKWNKANKAPVKEIEVETLDSKQYPDHMFKLNYFHSSYNEGGLNAILRTAVGKDLYYVFDHKSAGPYRFTPNWEQARLRAQELKAAYQAHLDSVGAVRVVAVSAAREGNPTNAAEAMEIFKKRQLEHDKEFAEGAEIPHWKSKDADWFSNNQGDFFLGKGATVLAAIPGNGYIGRCTYLVIREDGIGDVTANGTNWYIAALDIVIESCEYILSQKKPQQYCLHWSS